TVCRLAIIGLLEDSGRNTSYGPRPYSPEFSNTIMITILYVYIYIYIYIYIIIITDFRR
ncbi:hypothetical protein L9F63_009516, partial [Diploptera punctata]